MTVAHWDEAKGGRPDRPGLGGRWTNLAGPAGSRTVGVNRIQLDAGEVSTPAHVHGADEEIFFVLDGSGLSWQDGETYEVRAGDCLVHRPLGKAHTLRAGDDGLDVLAYGQRHRLGGAYLPKVGVYWLWPTWVEVGKEPNPFDREPDLDWPAPVARPESIVNLDDVEGEEGGAWKELGATAGSKQTGLNWVKLPPNEEDGPPHCHSAEEELFVVLDGEGTLDLWAAPKPGAPLPTKPQQAHPVRRGSVVARPAATRISHCFRSGEQGLTYLAYGTKEPNDMCYYPRSNKIFFRGLGLIARVEPLEYLDGEPA